jgi:Leucine rich repeat/Leucine Rich Repeat
MRALQWLIDEDLRTTESDERSLRQRYTLTTLWFQTMEGFGNTEFDATWATDVTECDWNSVDCTAGQVDSLTLSFDGIKGRIPDDLGLLTALTYLDLGYNALTGTIPSSFGSLTALTRLSLSGNALTGTIPTSLGSLAALNTLALSNNELTGTIPTSLGSLTDLTDLYLHDNALTGAVPVCSTERTFYQLVADCAEVSCLCCTDCCPTGQDGIPAHDYCVA